MGAGWQMSSAGLLRLAGLVSVAFGVLLVVTQLVGALAFVVLDGDPARRARSAWSGSTACGRCWPNTCCWARC
jgi:hypothetical protein